MTEGMMRLLALRTPAREMGNCWGHGVSDMAPSLKLCAFWVFSQTRNQHNLVCRVSVIWDQEECNSVAPNAQLFFSSLEVQHKIVDESRHTNISHIRRIG